jgi:hypothetical protein
MDSGPFLFNPKQRPSSRTCLPPSFSPASVQRTASRQKQKHNMNIYFYPTLVIFHIYINPTIHQHLRLRLRLRLHPQPLLSHDKPNILVRLLDRLIRGPLLLPLLQLPNDEMLTLSDDPPILRPPPLPRRLARQPPPGEGPLPPRPDLLHPFHRLQRRGDQVAVVLDGDVAPLGELAEQHVLVDDHLLAAQGAVGLGPLELPRLSLHLEVLVAFGAAEAEGAGVVAHKGDALGRVDWPGTEMAGVDSVGERELSF